MHGHPAYWVLLAVTVVASVAALSWQRRPRPTTLGWRRVGATALASGWVAWLAPILWLTPFEAREPAPAAVRSDDAVTVTESWTRIVMTPTATQGTASSAGLFHQPGARVEARAHAAVPRPIAEAGHPVVIVKQPLDIGFPTTGAF